MIPYQEAERTIKLTYLITDLKVGGVPLHLYRLANRLPRDLFNMQVISLAGEGPVGIMLRQAGIPVRVCGASSPYHLRALWRLWRFLRADPPDILHAMLFHANIAARVIGPLAGLAIQRILCEIQTVERERPWHLVIDNLSCRLCRQEIGNSPSVIEHLRCQAHIPRSRLHCESGGVDTRRFSTVAPLPKADLGIPENEPMILWTGRLDPVKGFEEMLAAFAQVNRRRPARLVLAGEGEYRHKIEKLIEYHRIQGRVLLLGRRSDIAELLKTADVFLFCSRTEGLPNALLEAMATGLPVVATRVPGCRDLVRDGENGLLASPGNADDIATKLEMLLADRIFARRLGRQAQTFIQTTADMDRVVKRWITLYQTMHRPAGKGVCSSTMIKL